MKLYEIIETTEKSPTKEELKKSELDRMIDEMTWEERTAYFHAIRDGSQSSECSYEPREITISPVEPFEPLY